MKYLVFGEVNRVSDSDKKKKNPKRTIAFEWWRQGSDMERCNEDGEGQSINDGGCIRR